jgi:signal transduction histidine kinase/CheY-like chemotaxis protein
VTHAVPNAPTQHIPCTDLNSITSQITHAMAEAVLTVARRLTSDAIHTLCKRLARAFVADLEQTGSTDFPSTLEEILWQVKETGDDAHMWQVALSVLREKVPALLEKCDAPITRQQVEDKLHQARTAISEAMEYQARQHVHNQRWAADRLALLTARLLTAQDETQISETLGELLPEVGIQHAGVAFFETEGDDPAAWSILHATPNLTTTTFRFASQQFPPKGLYPEDKPFSLALLPLVIQGEKAGFVALDTGNLELCGAIVQQLADALLSARLYREATEGRRLAEEANRMKSRFLSTVSHELRTPLNVIAGLSKLVLTEEKRTGSLFPETYRQDLERILASAEHLDGLIQDVLDLARSEVGQLKLVCEPLNLAEVLEIAIAVGEQLARDKGLSWRAEIPKDLPQVWGDRTRLRQIALNLINNAVKFTAQGKVVLQVEVKEDMVTVAVSDTGLGIPTGEQDVIFDEFRQSERTTARGYGGLGLGLAICRRLVELHDGTMGVQSSGEEGTGSTFYFTLPIIKRSPGAGVSTQVQSQRVLLISEHLGSGVQLCEHLSQQGFKVEEVGTDKTTDWLARLLASPPGAVLLDKALASEQGWQVLQVLKGNPATQDIPVMFYALSQVQDGGSMLELDYLTKPVGTVELARALKRQGLTSNGDDEKRILIVDDEPSILDMHARIVQAQSTTYRVLKAQNGREALELMRREQPHLVLLDLMMPEMDGFAVLEALQQEGETVRNIPVIVLTGQVLTEDDMNRLKGGVSAVLRKGLFSVEETLVHLEQALTRKRKLGSDMQRLVRKAMAYVHERYMEPISRADIAEYVGISSDHLTRSFRQETGLTVVAYLNRYRVNQAKTLLRESNRTVTEIARAVGFSDSNYFSRVFRQEVGTSPSAYRRTQNK